MLGFLIGTGVVVSGALAWDWRRSEKLKKALATPIPYPNSPGADGNAPESAARSKRSGAGKDPAPRQWPAYHPDLNNGGGGGGAF